jgi:hypothetical protein
MSGYWGIILNIIKFQTKYTVEELDSEFAEPLTVAIH